MAGRDYLALAREYEDGVRAGTIPACKWVRLACERNARDRARERTDLFQYWFDDASAVAICAAAEQFPHIRGDKAKVLGTDDDGRPIWQTIELEPWQCWVLTTLFGWLAVGTNLRRFRIGLVLVPRKNAKSTIAAVVLLFMLTADGEMGAECYSAATTEKQAKIVARVAHEMARRTPAFREFFGVKLGSKTSCSLEIPELASKSEPVTGDAESLDGLNVHFASVDELHAHRTRDLWDVLDTATGARDQPLILAITTAGVNIGGICYEQVSYLERILNGVLEDETYFGINYTIDEGDDPFAETTWRKSNPNYGVSVKPDDLARKAKRAQASSAALNNFLTKHNNVWVRGERTWMPMREWISLGDRTLKIEDFKDMPCWIGVDLAEIRDIAATVAIFRPDQKHYVAFARFYLPEGAIDKSPIAQMSGWVRDGYIIETDGDQADFERIEDDIFTWYELLNDVREIDFDRALAAHMAQSLKRRLQPHMGKDAVEQFVVTVNQNLETMNPAMQLTESLTLGGLVRHEANPAFNWMFSNVVVERNYKDEIYPRKLGGKDSPNKIDGPVAWFTALSRASQASIEPKRKRRGMRMWTPTGFVTLGEEQSNDAAHP
jgi:phage terminase large subunit-like protein